MRVLIAVDMEGISGVTQWDHVKPGHPEYTRFREIMTEEVNAAIDGALDGGATSIVVSDGHNNGCNILIEKLHAPARLNSGSPAPLSMVQGADQADRVFFVGYHARANTPDAVLCHTWTDQVRHVWLNQQEVGEIGLNAAVCGSFGAPVVLITGDLAAINEATELLGPIETVVVKTASGRIAAECNPIEEMRIAIRHTAAHAMVRQVEPYIVAAPITLRVELGRPDQIDRALRVPGSSRVDGVTIEWKGNEMVSVYHAFRAITGLGGSEADPITDKKHNPIGLPANSIGFLANPIGRSSTSIGSSSDSIGCPANSIGWSSNSIGWLSDAIGWPSDDN